MKEELLMICDLKGRPKKFISIDVDKLRTSEDEVDDLKKVFQTKRNPYHMSRITAKTPMNDPDLFMVMFQRVL